MMANMVSIKHSAYLSSLIKNKQMKTNKNIKKTVVEESLMLKLSLSATETQYLTEKTDQNP